MISIIIPAYNAEATLQRCLDSILAQTYTDFEALVIDDGSIDGTAAICREYASKDSRIKLLQKPNGGVSSARNFGLSHATGELIAFADSDDEVLPIWLETFYKLSHSDYKKQSLLVSNFMSLEPDGKKAYVDDTDKCDSLGEYYATSMFGAVWNKMYYSSVIKQYNIHFDTSLSFFEDWLFVAEYCSYMAEVRSSINTTYIFHYIVGSYEQKYGAARGLRAQICFYHKVKIINQLFSNSYIDGLCMNLLSSHSNICFIPEFKDAVGKDIRYAKGKKKFLIRALRHTDSLAIWKAVIRLYMFIYMKGWL